MLRVQKIVYIFASEGLIFLSLINKCSIFTVNMDEAGYQITSLCSSQLAVQIIFKTDFLSTWNAPLFSFSFTVESV